MTPPAAAMTCFACCRAGMPQPTLRPSCTGNIPSNRSLRQSDRRASRRFLPTERIKHMEQRCSDAPS
jgi:hypothetical protein